ncbi:MAG: hypothetical protein JXA90_00045, partial [Planctomycetes bacterium]|nr:hypothetical protein [Planctomycetota bacterium]
THPLTTDVGCVISRQVKVPAGRRTALDLVVANDPRGDFELIVKLDGEEALKKAVSKETTRDGWLETSVDLSRHAGRDVKVEIINQASGWSFEAAYFAKIAVSSRS